MCICQNSKIKCTFRILTFATAILELLVTVGLFICMVLSHRDAHHNKRHIVRLYNIFDTSSFLFQDYQGNDHSLDIFFGIGVFMVISCLAVDTLLFVAAVLKSRRLLYVWLFLATIVYVSGIILICLLFAKWSWMNFLLILVLTILKIFGFTIVLMFTSEIKAQELRAKKTDNQETQTQEASPGRHLVIELEDEEKRKALEIVSKFSQNPDVRNIYTARQSSRISSK